MDSKENARRAAGAERLFAERYRLNAVEPAPVFDANGNPVTVPEDVTVTDEFRTFMAGRVPAKGCPHYISVSEATAGFTTCENCYRKD